MFLWGDSAGGHLALLAALTGSAVGAVVAWFPVTDLVGMPFDLAEAGGVPDSGPDSREARLLGAPAASVPDLARQASPVAHVRAGAPPVLLMHGTADDLVPAAQSIRLAEALVAFVMGAFDPDNSLWFFRCGIWRLNVSAGEQGNGYGRFAVEAVLAEARRRGQERASVLWVPGPGSPEAFYLRLGFQPTGETFGGEVVGQISVG